MSDRQSLCAAAFVRSVSTGMKLLYDLLLWRAFSKLPPPEESAGSAAAASK